MGKAKSRWTLAEMTKAGLMYVPQEQLLSAPYRVRDHVRAIADTFGSTRLEEALHESGVEALLPLRARTLSGGERMRVSLALALVRAPRVLIIDEPLARLDPKDQERLGRVLRKLAAEGIAVVASGHDARTLLGLSDCIIWCVAGTTHHIGSPEDALSHAQFRREYLGVGFRE